MTWAQRLAIVSMIGLPAAACTNDQPTIVAEPTAGLRLVPLYRTAGTGRIFSGWFDNELKTGCHVGPAADGKTRCMPDGYAMEMFQDPTCQGEAVAISCKTERFISRLQFSGVSTGFELAPPTTPAGGRPPLFLLREDGCRPSEDIIGAIPPDVVRAVKTMVPDDRFAEMQETIVPLNEELDVIVLQGSDGSQSPQILRDHRRGALCTVLWTDTGRRCLPRSFSEGITGYADAACTMPLLTHGFTSTPFEMAVPDPGAPGAKPPFDPYGRRAKALFRFEAAPQDTATFVKTPSGCLRLPPEFSQAPTSVAVERLDTRVYPAIDPATRDVSSDRDFDVDGQRVVLADAPHELLRGSSQSCRINHLSGGRRACLDATPIEHIYWGDLQCHRRLALFNDPFVAPKRVLWAFGNPSFCGEAETRALSLRKVAASEAQLHWSSLDGTCAPSNASLHPGHDVFEVGGDTGLTTDDFVLGEPGAEM